MCRIWNCAVACLCVGLIAVGGFATDAPQPIEAPKKPAKDELKKMMIAVHRGETAPLARTGAELKKDAPNWEQLGKDAKEFTQMAEMLKVGASPYTDSKPYVSSAADFEKAATGKDAKKAGEALTGLHKSCTSCHYGQPK